MIFVKTNAIYLKIKKLIGIFFYLENVSTFNDEFYTLSYEVCSPAKK